MINCYEKHSFKIFEILEKGTYKPIDYVVTSGDEHVAISSYLQRSRPGTGMEEVDVLLKYIAPTIQEINAAINKYVPESSLPAKVKARNMRYSPKGTRGITDECVKAWCEEWHDRLAPMLSIHYSAVVKYRELEKKVRNTNKSVKTLYSPADPLENKVAAIRRVLAIAQSQLAKLKEIPFASPLLIADLTESIKILEERLANLLEEEHERKEKEAKRIKEELERAKEEQAKRDIARKKRLERERLEKAKHVPMPKPALAKDEPVQEDGESQEAFFKRKREWLNLFKINQVRKAQGLKPLKKKGKEKR